MVTCDQSGYNPSVPKFQAYLKNFENLGKFQAYLKLDKILQLACFSPLHHFKQNVLASLFFKYHQLQSLKSPAR